jgi:hypothetical protein
MMLLWKMGLVLSVVDFCGGDSISHGHSAPRQDFLDMCGQAFLIRTGEQCDPGCYLRRPDGKLNLLLLNGKNKQDILKCTICSTTTSTIITQNYESKVALFKSKVCQNFIDHRGVLLALLIAVVVVVVRVVNGRKDFPCPCPSIHPICRHGSIGMKSILKHRNLKFSKLYRTVVYLKYPARTKKISFPFTFPLTLHLDRPLKL